MVKTKQNECLKAMMTQHADYVMFFKQPSHYSAFFSYLIDPLFHNRAIFAYFQAIPW